MNPSDNISAIEAIEKAMEGGYWAASVHDCRPPHSRRDHPRKHSRVITLPEKFLTELEALEAGAGAIASGWAGSTIVHRESATHSALFELDRHRVTELVRALPVILAEARKTESMEREIAEKDAEIVKLRRLATDRAYMMQAYRDMLGPVGTEVAAMWERNGVTRQHTSWGPEAGSLTGEERAQVLMEVQTAPSGPVKFLDTKAPATSARTLLNGGSDAQG